MDEVEGWWITANVRRVPMSACRVEDRFFNLCGELCIMENEMKIHSQLDETKLKLDSSSLYNEVDPTGPAPARSVSSRSLVDARFQKHYYISDTPPTFAPLTLRLYSTFAILPIRATEVEAGRLDSHSGATRVLCCTSPHSTTL